MVTPDPAGHAIQDPAVDSIAGRAVVFTAGRVVECIVAPAADSTLAPAAGCIRDRAVDSTPVPVAECIRDRAAELTPGLRAVRGLIRGLGVHALLALKDPNGLGKIARIDLGGLLVTPCRDTSRTTAVIYISG